MMPDIVIAPFRALEGTDMKRVTQFDTYCLGVIRSLSYIKKGDHLSDRNDQLMMAYITADSFCKDELSSRLLPNSVIEAKHVRAVVSVLGDAMAGKDGLAAFADAAGNMSENAEASLSRAVAAFETALKHELNSLPTYVIEEIGIYDTDDLLTKADKAFTADVRAAVPDKALDDFRKAGACLGFELYTASGFHGYRAVDEMLRAYCVHFVGSLPSGRRDWGVFIQTIRGVTIPMARIPNKRTVELIDRVRAEDRNPLIHPETDLDASQAEMAFDLCRTAITFMAMDIKNAR